MHFNIFMSTQLLSQRKGIDYQCITLPIKKSGIAHFKN